MFRVPRQNDQKIYRVLDVNLNRAREGIRVVEDSLRLVWNSPLLYRQLRSVRHKLDVYAKKMHRSLILSRDSAQDVGKHAAVGRFESVESLVQANLRRAQEALRVLEEYARLIDTALTPRFQELRFLMYTIEKKIIKRIKC